MINVMTMSQCLFLMHTWSSVTWHIIRRGVFQMNNHFYTFCNSRSHKSDLGLLSWRQEISSNGFNWSTTPSPLLHPSDPLKKGHVKGHQRRVPDLLLHCGLAKTERPQKKKLFHQKFLWICANSLGSISTLRLRRFTQLEGKTKNRTQFKNNTVVHSSHAEATHGTHLESRMTCPTVIFPCGYTIIAPLPKPAAVIINPTHC